MLARVLRALRGDKYMVGAYPPAADAHGTNAQDRGVDGDGPDRSDVAERELPLHFAPPLSRAEER